MEAAPTASQRAAQAMTQKAVESGKVSAADVAKMTFDAIAAGQFYIFSHPGTLGGRLHQNHACARRGALGE